MVCAPDCLCIFNINAESILKEVIGIISEDEEGNNTNKKCPLKGLYVI